MIDMVLVWLKKLILGMEESIPNSGDTNNQIKRKKDE